HPERGGDIRNMPRRVSPLRRALRHAPSFAAWWVLSMVLWLLFTSTVAPSDAGLGMCASLVAAGAGVAVQSQGAFEFRPRLRWSRWWGADGLLAAGRGGHADRRRWLRGRGDARHHHGPAAGRAAGNGHHLAGVPAAGGGVRPEPVLRPRPDLGRAVVGREPVP